MVTDFIFPRGLVVGSMQVPLHTWSPCLQCSPQHRHTRSPCPLQEQMQRVDVGFSKACHGASMLTCWQVRSDCPFCQQLLVGLLRHMCLAEPGGFFAKPKLCCHELHVTLDGTHRRTAVQGAHLRPAAGGWSPPPAAGVQPRSSSWCGAPS